MITAELADGRVLEFPAGTDPSVIQATVKKMVSKPQSGFAMGLADPIHGGAQLLTKALPEGLVNAGNRANNWLAEKTGLVAKLPPGGVDQQVREREQAYQSARGDTGMDWARLGGNLASPTNLALAAAAPARLATLGGRVAAGAGLGAASALSEPVTDGDFAEQKAKQVGLGAVGGGAIPMLAAGAGRMVSPKASMNPQLALLQAEGVRPTVGQSLGGNWNKLEEKMTSIPIMGDAISSARGRALDQFNSAAINRASGKVGATVQDTGQAGVSQAAKAVGGAYDDAAGMVSGIKFDQKFNTDLKQLQGMAKSLVPDMRRKFDTKLRDVVGGRTSQANAMLPETFKRVDSEIGGLAAKYGRSPVASEQEAGDAFRQLQALLREQASRTDPAYGEALKAANAGYANLVRVEGAAKSAKNAGGLFTPAQLNMAIQSADNSVRKRSVSHGNALMQDLGNAGQSVLGNKVPNSFTADRALIAGGGLGAGLVNPAIPAGLIAGAAAYSPQVQSLLRSLVSARPELAQPIARILNQSSPMLAPAGGLLGLQMLNE